MKSARADDPLVSLFLELAGISSNSGHEREICDFLTVRLRGLGFEVSESDPIEDTPASAGNLYCRLDGDSPGVPILFSAHVDTVASEEDALPAPVLRDGVISSGSRSVLGADNKASVAVIVHTIEKIISEGVSHAGLELLLTVCEESGLQGAKSATLDHMAARCGFCFDCTGAVGGVVIKAPSQKTVKAVFSGKSAHAGVAPEEGRNAIEAASKAVASMKLGRIDDETTANIGIIRGGEAINVVPDRCRIEGESRSHDNGKLDGQIAHMLEAINLASAGQGVDVETVIVDEFQAFDLGSGNLPVDLADRALKKIGIEPTHIVTGGGSDVNVFNQKGLPSVNLAAGMEKVHTPEEYIAVKSLYDLHRLMLAIVEEAMA